MFAETAVAETVDEELAATEGLEERLVFVVEEVEAAVAVLAFLDRADGCRCGSLLPRARAARPIPLEHHAGRVRHRYRLPQCIRARARARTTSTVHRRKDVHRCSESSLG